MTLARRTTHITGLLTDLGQFIGMRVAGHHVEGWKITTPLFLALSFLAEAAISSWLSLATLVKVTFAAGIIYLTTGIIRSALKQR